MAQGVYWVGSDNNVYTKAAGQNGVQNAGAYGVINPNKYAGLSYIADPNAPQQQSGNYTNTTASSGTSAADTAAANAAYNTQNANLNDLLGRTNTSLQQGLDNLNSQYQGNVNTQTNQYNQELQDLAEKGQADTQAKQTAYDTINQNANNGYRSLAQIIGRNAGTGSSAFQELLPNVIGNDISSKRSAANTTYATNAASLAKAKTEDDQSFADVLANLASQRNQGENTLRTGVEQQRQSILGQQQQLEANRGNLAGVNALQGSIQNSRNAVDNFFNQFQSPITAQTQAIATPTLSTYDVDRSAVNAAGNSDITDDSNPYAQILKKQLQGAS